MALFRWLLWSFVLRVVASLRVSGRLPDGPCVVVANHSSHADTPAILAALGPRPVAVLAAADYWTGWRAAVCGALAGGVPIRRTGGGGRDLAPIVELLRSGTTVVVFPEGTRGDGDELGRFRSGARVLADQSGVPIVPVAVAGTGRLLPRHGRFRPAPVAVRIGEPLDADDDARTAVAHLLTTTCPAWHGARLRHLLTRAARSRRAPWVVASWAAAEALSWPVIPELAVALLVLAVPRRAPRLAAAAMAGSTLGLLAAYGIAAAGVQLPQPATTPAMRTAVRASYDASPAFTATRGQAMSGIPGKVYAAEAGARGADRSDVLAGWLVGRGSRLLVVAALAAVAGSLLRGPLLAPAVVIGLSGFLAGWARVLAGWR